MTWSETIAQIVRSAEQAGVITHDQINALLPEEPLTARQIEEVLDALSENGIQIVSRLDP